MGYPLAHEVLGSRETVMFAKKLKREGSKPAMLITGRTIPLPRIRRSSVRLRICASTPGSRIIKDGFGHEGGN